jgi:hypothetical protein
MAEQTAACCQKLGLSRSLQRIDTVLCAVEHGPPLADLLELEDGLHLLGAPRRLDKNETQDVTAGQCDFGMIGKLLEGGLDVRVGRFDLGLFWCRDLAGDRRRFLEGREIDLERDECCVGKADAIDVRAMLGDRERLGAGAGQTADTAGQAEFDGIDDAAFA